MENPNWADPYVDAIRNLSREYNSYFFTLSSGLYDQPPVLIVRHKAEFFRKHEMICQPGTFLLNLEFLKGRLLR